MTSVATSTIGNKTLKRVKFEMLMFTFLNSFAVNCFFPLFTLSQALSWISLSVLFVQAMDCEPAGFLNFLLTFPAFCYQMAAFLS